MRVTLLDMQRIYRRVAPFEMRGDSLSNNVGREPRALTSGPTARWRCIRRVDGNDGMQGVGRGAACSRGIAADLSLPSPSHQG
jgi:hypothetical protein